MILSSCSTVFIESVPPSAIASRALRNRFKNTCCSWSSSAKTGERFSVRLFSISMFWNASSKLASLKAVCIVWFIFTSIFAPGRVRAKLVISVVTRVIRWIWSETILSFSSVSCEWPSWVRIIWTSDEIDASGLLTSWAIPAASVPIAASFSTRINCSLRRFNSAMSEAILRLISLNESASRPISSLLLRRSTSVPYPPFVTSTAASVIRCSGREIVRRTSSNSSRLGMSAEITLKTRYRRHAS